MTFRTFICCGSRFSLNRKRTKKSVSKIVRQFDIVKIVKNLRAVSLISFSQLNYAQRQMALNLSNQIWVSSDSDAIKDEVVECENQDFMKIN